MPHPGYKPGSYPSHLLAREESDFIFPMKLLAAKAVCIVRLCVSPALRDEEGREDGGAELAVFRQNCSVHPGSQGIPAERRDDKQAGKCRYRLFRLVPLGGVAECQTLLHALSPARALGRWQARPPPALTALQMVLEAAHLSALLACSVVSLVTEQGPHPTMAMQGENDMLFTEHQSSPGLRQWYQGHLSVAARRGCPGAARADLSQQPVPGDVSKDSTSTRCGFCYSPLELTVAPMAPTGERHGWRGTSHPPGGAQHGFHCTEIRAWSPGPSPAALPSAQPFQGLKANSMIHCSATAGVSGSNGRVRSCD